MADYDEMKDQIITAAREIFARYGYRKTTMDDIAASIYKAKSSIYHYFGSKEDIFRAVIDREATQIFQKTIAAINAADTPAEKISAYINAGYKAIQETGNYFRLLVDEWFEIFDFTEDVKRKHEALGIDMLTSILREGNASGDFALEHPEEYAKAISVAMQGYWLPMGRLRRDYGSENLDAFVWMILHGLLKR